MTSKPLPTFERSFVRDVLYSSDSPSSTFQLGWQTLLNEMGKNVNEPRRRDIIIRCLVEYLGESGEELIKDYQDVSQEAVKEDCSNHMMQINVIHPNVAQEIQDPVDHKGPAMEARVARGARSTPPPSVNSAVREERSDLIWTALV
ncbi:unnamed protein product [Gadus morhua 'NCC']